MIDLQTTIDGLKDNGFNFITSYSNGVESWYGFDEEREVEITIKINTSPDEEDIKNFNENFIPDIDEKQEARADLIRKYDNPVLDDEGEDEGLKAIREYEDCTDVIAEAEAQENFCN